MEEAVVMMNYFYLWEKIQVAGIGPAYLTSCQAVQDVTMEGLYACDFLELCRETGKLQRYNG